MALQRLQITAITAMRARDVSRPTPAEQSAADSRPLRDEAPRRNLRRDAKGGTTKIASGTA